jgi:hypothetical protein
MLNCMIPLWPTYPQSPDARAAEGVRHSITQCLLHHVTSVTQQDNVTTLPFLAPERVSDLWSLCAVGRGHCLDESCSKQSLE